MTATTTTWPDLIHYLTTTTTNNSKDSNNNPPTKTVVVCGPRGSGKSYLSRIILERLYPNSLYVDLDPLKPDLTVPGLIGCWHGKKFVHGFFFGEKDPRTRPRDYLDGVHDILRLTRIKIQQSTSGIQIVIINTCAWITGVIQDVLESIILASQCTDVVQIMPSTKLESVGTLLRESAFMDGRKVWTLLAHDNRQRESKVIRDIRMAEYFFNASIFAIGMSQVQILFPSLVVDSKLPREHLLTILDFALVGLYCRRNSSNNDQQLTTSSCENFIGLGLIVSIDTSRSILFIQSTISWEEIKLVTDLLIGTSARLPLLSFMDSDASNDSIPYLTNVPVIGFSKFV
jgi:polynucleotide 5'-kinase involved in rRNA processing